MAAPSSAAATTNAALLLPDLVVLGDTFVDVMVGRLPHLPIWGGDVLLDRPVALMAGGSALNTAVHAADLLSLPGTPLQTETATSTPTPTPTTPAPAVVLCSPIGPDAAGVIARQRLEQSGVQHCQPDKSRPEGDAASPAPGEVQTGSCVVLFGETERSFATYRGDVAVMACSMFDWAGRLQPRMGHLHLAGFYNCPGLWPGLPALFRALRADGITTSLCAQYDARDRWDEVQPLFPLTDVLLLNELEAERLSGQADSERAARALLDRGVGLVVITLGAAGVLALSAATGLVRQPAPRVDAVVDTTGAGDCFCAGFLTAWTRGRRRSPPPQTAADASLRRLRLALQLGVAAGSACVAQLGASPSLPHGAVLALLRQQEGQEVGDGAGAGGS